MHVKCVCEKEGEVGCAKTGEPRYFPGSDGGLICKTTSRSQVCPRPWSNPRSPTAYLKRWVRRLLSGSRRTGLRRSQTIEVHPPIAVAPAPLLIPAQKKSKAAANPAHNATVAFRARRRRRSRYRSPCARRLLFPSNLRWPSKHHLALNTLNSPYSYPPLSR